MYRGEKAYEKSVALVYRSSGLCPCIIIDCSPVIHLDSFFPMFPMLLSLSLSVYVCVYIYCCLWNSNGLAKLPTTAFKRESQLFFKHLIGIFESSVDAI